ncbi:MULTISPECIES: hypothetical protein [unclassified Paenibacillus]|uniref:hypothetical protein n=1 Tax=unclassified Paenibacillus TaxID=185978 RepID=UPI003628C077
MVTISINKQWIEYMTFDGESSMADLRKANGRERYWELAYFGIGNENWGCDSRMRGRLSTLTRADGSSL